jgi:hypothetical protein
MNIEIKNGRLIDPANAVDAAQSLFIAEGRIAALGTAAQGFNPDRVIDAAGKIVCPGLVDLSARLREPGNEHKATLESEMRAAVAGGVTSLVCPPDTDPPLDEPGLVEMLKRRADSLKQARVYPLGALTQGLKGARLAEMGELTEAGCVGFFQADHPLTDTNVLWRAMQYAATHGFTLWLRPEDAHLAAGGVAHDGEMATRLGLPAIPAIAETIAVQTIVTLVAGYTSHDCLPRPASPSSPPPSAANCPSPAMSASTTSCSRIATSATSIRNTASRRRCAMCATAMRCVKVWCPASSTPSAPTTRRSMMTRSRSRSTRPRRVPRVLSCCSRSRSSSLPR